MKQKKHLSNKNQVLKEQLIKINTKKDCDLSKGKKKSSNLLLI